MVSDCGLSQTTLEEVFMLVTGKKKPKEKKNVTNNDSSLKSLSTKRYEEVKGAEDMNLNDPFFDHQDLRKSIIHNSE